jgi:hypothetical protein
MATTVSKNFRKQALTVVTLDGTEGTTLKILVNPNAVNGDTRAYTFIPSVVTSAGAPVSITSAKYNVTGTDAGKVTIVMASNTAGNRVILNGAIDYETKIIYT